MAKKPIPDAWDDDWEAQADAAEAEVENTKIEEVKITKAERLAQHAETNRKIWESAEEPDVPFFLAAREDPPFKTEFKPALKVLSRKPTPKVIQRVDPVTGLAKMTLEDEEEEEEEEEKQNQPTPEELRIKAQKEREEKQRKYDEARARILGTSGNSSSGVTTPPEEGRSSRGKRGGRGGGRTENQRPSSSQSGSKESFVPNYTPKPGVTIQKRNGETQRSSPRPEDQVIRAPRGPDGNSKGFGLANRGGKSS